jgi:branched-chain amino acid aminotransferase
MSIIYFNGDFIESDTPFISHKDCGFTTGIGVFDSMLALDGQAQHLDEHFERIMHDTKTVIGVIPELNDFKKIVADLLEKNSLSKGYARIRTTVTGGVAGTPLAKAENLTALIDVAPCTAPPDTPITCAIIKDYPRIAGCILENCKRLDYSRSYAARRQAENMGASEAILTNTDGNIACGATSNIFIKENGVLITPPLSDGVLAGVTRRKILDGKLPPLPTLSPKGEGYRDSTTHTPSPLRGEGWGEGIVKAIENSISPTRLKNADKIYLTNSFIGLRPVALVE